MNLSKWRALNEILSAVNEAMYTAYTALTLLFMVLLWHQVPDDEKWVSYGFTATVCAIWSRREPKP